MQDLTKKQQYWKAHLDALESFEGSAADYARLHDLQPKRLYAYKTQLRKLEKTSEISAGFVKVTRTTAGVSSPVTVSLPNGVRLTLPSLDIPGLLEQLAHL